MEKLYILGAGAYGDVVFELAESNGFVVAGYYDDTKAKGDLVNGVPVLGGIKDLLEEESLEGFYAVSVGAVEHRVRFLRNIRRMGGKTPALIHPAAVVSPSVRIGEGSCIQAGASLWTKVEVGKDCVVAPMASVSHHTVLMDGCFVSPGATVGSSMVLEERVFVGMGAVVMSGVKRIGEGAYIGAGSLVIRDVAAGKLVYGSPARERK